jgi:hypothetical protein
LSPIDIWTVGSGDRFFGFDQGEALIQHWDGRRWQESLASAPQGTTLKALAAIRSDDIWAAGDVATNGHSRSILLHWDGHRWQSSLAPDAIQNESVLFGVAAVSSTDVWAVGRYYDVGAAQTRPLLLHWDGNRWSQGVPVSLPPSYSTLQAVVALAANDVWAVGWMDTQIQLTTLGHQYPVAGSATYIVHWDGVRWTQVPSPNPGYASNELLSVVAGAGGQLWAVGSYSNDPSRNQSSTLALRWNGTAWDQVPSPDGNPQSLNALYGATVLAANDVWAVGQHRGTNGFGVRALILHWDGSIWSLVPRPEPQSNQSLSGITAIPGQGIAAVGWSANKDGIMNSLVARFLPGFCSSAPPTPYPD